MSLLPSVNKRNSHYQQTPPLSSSSTPNPNPNPPYAPPSTSRSSSRASLFTKKQQQQQSRPASNGPATNHTITAATTTPNSNPHAYSDPKELAALQRNVESLTKVSRSNAKTMATLNQQVKRLQAQLQTSKVEARAAKEEVQQLLNATPEIDLATTAQLNKLNRRVRELSHELTLAQQSEQKASNALQSMKDQQTNSIHVRSSGSGSQSSDGKLRQQLQTVSAHAKSLLVKNEQLEREMLQLRTGAEETRQTKEKYGLLQIELAKAHDTSQQDLATVNRLKIECTTCQQQCAVAQQRRQQHALDLSHRTQELLRYKSDNAMMQRKMEDTHLLLARVKEKDTELLQLKQMLAASNKKLSTAHVSQGTLEEQKRQWEEDQATLRQAQSTIQEKCQEVEGKTCLNTLYDGEVHLLSENSPPFPFVFVCFFFFFFFKFFCIWCVVQAFDEQIMD